MTHGSDGKKTSTTITTAATNCTQSRNHGNNDDCNDADNSSGGHQQRTNVPCEGGIGFQARPAGGLPHAAGASQCSFWNFPSCRFVKNNRRNVRNVRLDIFQSRGVKASTGTHGEPVVPPDSLKNEMCVLNILSRDQFCFRYAMVPSLSDMPSDQHVARQNTQNHQGEGAKAVVPQSAGNTPKARTCLSPLVTTLAIAPVCALSTATPRAWAPSAPPPRSPLPSVLAQDLR